MAALFVAVSLWLSSTLGAWTDEASTMATTGAGFAHAWRQAIHYELQPPLYFVALAAWRALSSSIFWARAFSALAAGGAILVTAGLARPAIGRRDATMLALLLAMNPWVLWAGSEARAYALVLLAVALVLGAWRWRFVARAADSPRWPCRVALVLAAEMLLLSHYYGGFLLAAGILPLMLRRRWRDSAEYLLLMLVVLALALPVLVHVPDQIRGHGATSGGSSPWAALRFMAYRLETLVLPVGEATASVGAWPARRVATWAARLTVVAVLLLGGMRTWRASGSGRREEIRWTLAVSVGTLLAFTVMRMNGPEALVAERHLMLLVVPCLLVLLLLMAGGGRWPFAIWLAVTVVSFAMLDWDRFSPLAKPGDTRRVAAYLQARARQGDVIMVFRPSLAAGLALEYHGPATLVALPAPITYRATDRFDVGGESLSDTVALAARVDSATRQANGAWLVSEPAPPYLHTDFHPERLEQVIRPRFRVGGTAVFHGGVLVRSLVHR